VYYDKPRVAVIVWRDFLRPLRKGGWRDTTDWGFAGAVQFEKILNLKRKEFVWSPVWGSRSIMPSLVSSFLHTNFITNWWLRLRQKHKPLVAIDVKDYNALRACKCFK